MAGHAQAEPPGVGRAEKTVDPREITRINRAGGYRGQPARSALRSLPGRARSARRIAPWFGPLSAAEVRHLMQHEWARTADDVLWRRTKCGLAMKASDRERVAAYMANAAATTCAAQPA